MPIHVRPFLPPFLGVALLASLPCTQAATLQAAASALDAAIIKSIEYSGSGRWFQFGQAPAPALPWPAFDVSSYTAAIDYETASARVQITRSQVVETGRLRPAPVEQRVDQYLAGGSAWNPPCRGQRRAGRHRAAGRCRRTRGRDLGVAAGIPEGGAGQSGQFAAGRRRR